MLMLLSPAKRLIEGAAHADHAHTLPALLHETATLAGLTATLSARDLQDLMHISETLADLNVARFERLVPTPAADNARQAVYTFDGDVYRGLDADSLDGEAVTWAQDHLRILSGLYGVLRPLDLVQPYRLEMGTKLANARGKNLYAFWGDQLAAALDADLAGHTDPTVLNLASTEYSKAALRPALTRDAGRRVITPVFKERKEGRSRVISFMAKVARGRMARFVIDHRLTQAEQVKAYTLDGYTWMPDASTDTMWVFERPQPPPAKKAR